MGRVIAIANQKGGVGKTTTTINLGACLAIEGKRVLIIDLDPQSNTTTGLGIDATGLELSVYNLLIENAPIADIIQPTMVEGLSIVPSTIDLAGAEIELVAMEHRESVLKERIKSEVERMDYILIDCPPSLGLLTINGLTAADSVLIPIQCEYYALEGLTLLSNTIQKIQSHLNPDLALEGILLTMFDGRTNLSIQVVEEVKKHFRQHVFANIVPRNVRLSEAPSHGLPIILYDPKSRGAEVYSDLAKEVIEREQQKGVG